jgi:pimeloyl-CoA dehydrogenase small subunit
MDFDLSHTQRLLKESVDRLCADRYSFEQRKLLVANSESPNRAMWAQFAELGLLGAPFEERYGGFDGGSVETMIVMEAFGRALVVEPYISTVVLGGGFLRHGASQEQREAIIPAIINGELTLAFAHVERHSRYDLSDVTTTARRDADRWVLDGKKSVVLHGDSADQLIVTARCSGQQRDKAGIGLFLVDPRAPGVHRRGYPTQDEMRAAEISLAGVRIAGSATLGEPGNAWRLIERVVDEAKVALCAEAVGAMTALLDLTVDYLKTRTQFGRPIGNFQALQHRAADMLIALEQARSMSMLATIMVNDEDVEARRHTVDAAKVLVGRSARFVGQQAIQLHGGIGMTMEYQAGVYFKRLSMIDAMFGDADYHLAALAKNGGLVI